MRLREVVVERRLTVPLRFTVERFAAGRLVAARLEGLPATERLRAVVEVLRAPVVVLRAVDGLRRVALRVALVARGDVVLRRRVAVEAVVRFAVVRFAAVPFVVGRFAVVRLLALRLAVARFVVGRFVARVEVVRLVGLRLAAPVALRAGRLRAVALGALLRDLLAAWVRLRAGAVRRLDVVLLRVVGIVVLLRIGVALAPPRAALRRDSPGRLQEKGRPPCLLRPGCE